MALPEGEAVVFSASSDGQRNVAPIAAAENAAATPAKQITPATGAKDSIDFELYNHWLQHANLTWLTTDPPAKLLWYSEVAPAKSHMLMRHLAAMYNTWRGGFDYKFKIAGTGFHAGSLMIVRLPPNLHPSNYTTTAQISAFSYMVLDPKLVECVSLEVIDQTDVMYHLTKFSASDTRTFGGYIAIYVLQQLSTSSTGADRVTIEAFTKPHADFKFAQLIPPDSGPSGPDVDYAALYLHQDAPVEPATGLAPIVSLRFSNLTGIVDDVAKWGHLDLDGTVPKVGNKPCAPAGASMNELYIQMRDDGGTIKGKPMFWTGKAVTDGWVELLTWCKFMQAGYRMYSRADDDPPVFTAGAKQYLWSNAFIPDKVSGGTEANMYRVTYDTNFGNITFGWDTATSPYATLSPVHPQDRILEFVSTSTQYLVCTQMNSMIDAILVNPLKLGVGKGLLFAIVNKSTGVTKCYVRWAKNGLLTYSNVLGVPADINFMEHRFVYISEILDTQPIPASSSVWNQRKQPIPLESCQTYKQIHYNISFHCSQIDRRATEVLAACNRIVEGNEFITTLHTLAGPVSVPAGLRRSELLTLLAILHGTQLVVFDRLDRDILLRHSGGSLGLTRGEAVHVESETTQRGEIVVNGRLAPALGFCDTSGN